MHLAEGTIELQVPQVRETLEPFESIWLQAIGKRSARLLQMIPMLYVKGMSQRDIEAALIDALGVEGTGRSVITEVCRSLRGDFERWQDRDLSEYRLLYLFLDGIYLRLHPDAKRTVAVLCAYGILWDGQKILLHLAVGEKESATCWEAFLEDLKARGMHEPVLAVVDGNAGVRKALRHKFPHTLVQRCQVHRLRNVLAKLPEVARPLIKKLILKAFTATSFTKGLALGQTLIAQHKEAFPDAMKCFERDLEECLTVLKFPFAHRAKIRTTNLLERLFGEGKRRTKIIPRFTSESSGMMLLFAVLVDASEGWRGVRMPAHITARLQQMAEHPDSEWEDPDLTKDIKTCKLVAEELQAFLQEWEEISAGDAERKVLPVSSATEHQPNVARLKTVDRPNSKVEWIVSVSMLSEGWDVKNVFQIVPHEERAFNSKLLIAQVLGRGLRRPDGWQGADPIVTVFNHDAWVGRIRHLVDEILEMENRLSSSVIDESPYHFDLHNLDYTRETDTSHFAKKGEYRLLEEGHVDLPSQVEVEDVAIDFVQAVTGNHTKFKTKLEHKTYSFEDVAEEMYRRLQSIDEESKDARDPKDRTQYAKRFPFERCLEIVKASAKRAKIKTGRIIEENRQKILQALGPLQRKSAKRVIYKLTPNVLQTFSTKERPVISVSAAELRRGDKTVFFTPNTEKTLPDEQREFFDIVRDEDGDYRMGSKTILNSHDFKTPCNMAIADWTPERRFIGLLCERDNAQVIEGWLKNSPQRFYAIEYAWKKGEHPKRGEFNPDFFIKKDKTIYVVEIKDDDEIGDPSPENKKKFEYARDHFERLNEWLKNAEIDVTYQLNFLTPRDFNKFFIKLRNDDARGFRSELDVRLSQPNGSA